MDWIVLIVCVVGGAFIGATILTRWNKAIAPTKEDKQRQGVEKEEQA